MDQNDEDRPKSDGEDIIRMLDGLNENQIRALEIGGLFSPKNQIELLKMSVATVSFGTLVMQVLARDPDIRERSRSELRQATEMLRIMSDALKTMIGRPVASVKAMLEKREGEDGE